MSAEAVAARHQMPAAATFGHGVQPGVPVRRAGRCRIAGVGSDSVDTLPRNLIAQFRKKMSEEGSKLGTNLRWLLLVRGSAFASASNMPRCLGRPKSREQHLAASNISRFRFASEMSCRDVSLQSNISRHPKTAPSLADAAGRHGDTRAACCRRCLLLARDGSLLRRAFAASDCHSSCWRRCPPLRPSRQRPYAARCSPPARGVAEAGRHRDAHSEQPHLDNGRSGPPRRDRAVEYALRS